MLGYEHNHGSKSMTLPSKGNMNLTDEEFNEMTALKNVINQRPAAVVPEKMEQFTEYLVRSLREKGG
jgi:hypothetical protein